MLTLLLIFMVCAVATVLGQQLDRWFEKDLSSQPRKPGDTLILRYEGTLPPQLHIMEGPFDMSNWETYLNKDFYFNFRYPDDSALLREVPDVKRAYLHQDWHLLSVLEKTPGTIPMAPQIFSFNIDLLTANDDNGKKITNLDDFLKNYSRRRIHRIREERGFIGDIPTVEDIWPTKDSGISSSSNESKTVYALYNDLVYKITVVPNSGIPAAMLSSFQFTRPKVITPVGSPTKKRTDYVNNTLGFSLTFPGGWYFSSPDDDRASISNCLIARGIIYRPSCGAFTIDDISSDGIPDQESIKNNLAAYGENAEIIDNLIRGAVVVKADSIAIDGPPLPEGFVYYVFFQGKEKAFKVFLTDIEYEKTILPSMKLLD